MKMTAGRHVSGLIKSVGKLAVMPDLSGLTLVMVLLVSSFLASCTGIVAKEASATSTPGFGLSASPSGLTVAQGLTGSSIVTVTPENGFTGSVNLSASGLPSGITASFSSNPATSMSTLTLTASSGATMGMSTVTITGTLGTLSHTTTIDRKSVV